MVFKKIRNTIQFRITWELRIYFTKTCRCIPYMTTVNYCSLYDARLKHVLQIFIFASCSNSSNSQAASLDFELCPFLQFFSEIAALFIFGMLVSFTLNAWSWGDKIHTKFVCSLLRNGNYLRLYKAKQAKIKNVAI